MPKSKVEQWLIDNPDVSFDYEYLVKLIRSSQRIECVVSINGKNKLAYAECEKTTRGNALIIATDDDRFIHYSWNQFINFCEEKEVLFAKPDFLKSTRKMLEIAANAAQFKPIVIPLNTREDVSVMIALMNKSERIN